MADKMWPTFKFLHGYWRIMDTVDGAIVPRVLIQEADSKRWVPTTVCD